MTELRIFVLQKIEKILIKYATTVSVLQPAFLIH